MKSKKIKNWNVNADHRPLAVIDAEKLNQKRQEEKKKKLFDCFCIGDLAFEVGKIAFIDGIKGTNINKVKFERKVDKILDLCDDLQKSEFGQVVNLHPDYIEVMENEHAVEIYRWFQLMAFYPTDHLRDFNDGVEAQNEARKNGIEPDPLFTKEDLQKAFEAGMKEERDLQTTEFAHIGFDQFYSRIKKERIENDND